MKNKRLFYGVLVVCLLAAVGISLFSGQKKPSPQPAVEDFAYKIKPCEERKPNSIVLSQVGDAIKFIQVFNTYCNASQDNLTIRYSLSNSNIEIRGVFDAQTVTRCICPLEIEGQINNLEKGRYKIKFVFDNRYVDQIEVLEEREFELK